MDLSAVVADVDAFYAAFADGDVPALQAFFARDAVRRVVAATNAYVVAHAPQDDVFIIPRPATATHNHHHRRPSIPRYVYPWYYTKPPPGVLAPHRFLIGIAIENARFELLAWLFAEAQVPLMGETLAVALPLAARLAINTSDVETLELLLTSPAFLKCLSSSRQQDALDKMLAQVRVSGSSDEVVKLLIAHGARVHTEDARETECVVGAWIVDRRRALLLADHGAFDAI